jgi:hypothetical protein
MPSAKTCKQKMSTGDYQHLADALEAYAAVHQQATQHYEKLRLKPQLISTTITSLAPTHLLDSLRSVAVSAERPPAHQPGRNVRLGSHYIAPKIGQEVPFGRNYQAIPFNSISRLAGYIGLDEYSLYIREVLDAPEFGLRPSRNGIWVRQPHEKDYRRLAPGQAERINPDTYIRVGGNGVNPSSGMPVIVLA